MELFASPLFRVYGSHDVIGVQVGGAVKNVIALAGGMVDELGFEYNTKAALLTRGLVEITRLGLKLGGEKETFSGISGLGDLICTAFSPTSRNYRAGRMFAKSLRRVEVEKNIGEVVEGINASRILIKLAERENVEMPISQGVYRVVWDGIDPKKVIEELMSRKLKFE
jgi:glycerol-3-phosphate dehydrogenase (NAD(P)+)